jgi:ABC-2 type transport system ATP-binding protein
LKVDFPYDGAMTPEPSDLVIEARGLTRIFRDFWGRPKVCAVKDVDLAVRSGTIFGLLGPNGSGKSTTMKMILGLLQPTRGTLSVLGKSPSDVATKARVGFMPEESYLYKYLTPEEILSFYARLYGKSSRESRDRIDALITQLGLAPARNRRIGEFSKGMARRVGLAQALLNEPDLLLLDEPTSGLDPIARRQVKDLLMDLARRGKTILICSHHLADMQDVCDQVVILLDGQICAQGAIGELLRKHDSPRLSLQGCSEAMLPRILAFIEQETGFKPDVDYTGRTLEALFVATVTDRSTRP